MGIPGISWEFLGIPGKSWEFWEFWEFLGIPQLRSCYTVTPLHRQTVTPRPSDTRKNVLPFPSPISLPSPYTIPTPFSPTFILLFSFNHLPSLHPGPDSLSYIVCTPASQVFLHTLLKQCTRSTSTNADALRGRTQVPPHPRDGSSSSTARKSAGAQLRRRGGGRRVGGCRLHPPRSPQYTDCGRGCDVWGSGCGRWYVGDVGGKCDKTHLLLRR